MGELQSGHKKATRNGPSPSFWISSQSSSHLFFYFLPVFSAPVWRVSWSLTGNILAVACGDNTVSLWKEAANNEWKCLSTLNESEPAVAGEL